MRKKMCLLLFALCLLLAACGSEKDSAPASAPAELPQETAAPDEPPAPELSQREQDWIEDIEFLREEYKAKHMAPFYLCSEEEFDWKLDQLETKVGELSDNDIYFELLAVLAGMGDLHTYILPGESIYDRVFPVGVGYFDNKLYLTACYEGYEQLAPYLLHEIVAVNGVDIAYINQKVDSLGNAFNAWYGRAVYPRAHMLFVPAFFDWVGCDHKEGYTFQILNDNREVESVEVPAVAAGDWPEGEWVFPENWDALLYQKGGNWLTYLEDERGGCVYVSLTDLSDAASIGQLAVEGQRLREEGKDCGKLVIDLRQDLGGYGTSAQVAWYMAQALKPERTYVLTGGMTASASTRLIAYLKSDMDALIVGEPTGQFPSFFHQSGADVEPSVLPNSQLTVGLSDLWWTQEDLDIDEAPVFEEYYDEDGRLYPWEGTILPDVYVYQDIEDIRQGKDSVLEWVLAQ